MYASIIVLKLICVIKVINRILSFLFDIALLTDYPFMVDLSYSIYVGTRKKMNYTCTG